MKTEELNEILAKVFLEVLEQHSFLILDPINTEEALSTAPDQLNKYLQIQMSVKINHTTGPSIGNFLFILPPQLNQEIEENLSGQVTSMSDPLDADGAKETLNIVGANIIGEAFGAETSFDISVPSVTLFNPSEMAKLKNLPCKTAFMLEGQPLFLFLELNGT